VREQVGQQVDQAYWVHAQVEHTKGRCASYQPGCCPIWGSALAWQCCQEAAARCCRFLVAFFLWQEEEPAWDKELALYHGQGKSP